MYNRYVPQPDGSYRRSRVPEPNRPQPQNRRQPPCPAPEKPECPPPPPAPERCNEMHHTPRSSSPGSFLKNLLPKDFDTGDLIIVLLLLLMAGDCEEDRSNALLTLALYFLM